MNKPLLIFFACLLAACGPPSHITRKADLPVAERPQGNDTIHRSYAHDTEAMIVRLADGGYEKIANRKGHSIISYSFYYPSGQLKSHSSKTNGFYFGKTVVYDLSGHRQSLTDNDAPYKVTVIHLGAKFAFGYGLDIFGENATIVRAQEENVPVYRITFRLNTPEGNRARRFVIDGITEKILSDTFVTLPQKEISEARK